MDQNRTVDNDLQKAIDDITNNTNIDPVFSDPVAAPSSVPEGDTGELGEPVGPFPESKVGVVAPGPEPIAPIEPMNIPELKVPEMPAPAEMPPMPPAPEVAVEPAPAVESVTAPVEEVSQPLNMGQVKMAALRDLIPLLDHLNMDATEKFNIYKDIFDDLKDYTVLEPAYRAAREIPDEAVRAEALLYLVQSIDKM